MSAIRRLAAALCLSAAVAAPAAAAELSWSAMTGYQDGWAFRGTGTVSRIVPGTPLGLSFGGGLTFMDPGNADAARRVFINDATNGTPEKNGYMWDLRLDGIWYFAVSHLVDSGAFLGLRYNSFAGRFKYVGGNEDFTIESKEWGVGGGFRGAIPLSARWNLCFALGLDWFPSVTLYGHDTSYSSGGEVVNGIDNYGWSDASAAVNRWRLLPSLMIGASWR